ncbi:MAG: ribonuclease VapC [Porticoccaceae bacterium]
MRVYFDSSALAKRYIEETGTAEVMAWCERADELALSVVAIPELISAFCRLRREGRITDDQYQGIKRNLLADIEDALICETTPEVVQHAVRALETHPLRGLDAIHIGATLACEADVFLSADIRQGQTAAKLGIQVVGL